MDTSGKQLGPLRGHVNRAAMESVSDRDLLARFVQSRDNEAFAVIIQRHGPAVLNHCRRILGSHAVADDAFQATFLVLARKAKSLRRPEALAAWLYGTARRVALRARRRMTNHLSLLNPPASTRDPLAEISARELLNVLDEELARLPERFRMPILLCGIEGRTVSETARALGTTPSAVKGRLERGRATLRRRLAARGLSLPAALAALLVEPRQSVSAALIEAATATATSSRPSPGVSALAGRTLPIRINFKLILAAVVLLGAGVGTAVVFRSPAASELPGPKPPEPVKQEEGLPAGALRRYGSLALRGCRGPAVFSPDGKFIAVAGREAADIVVVFDVQTGREVKSFHVDTTISRLAFSPDGRRLAAVGNGYNANCVWDFESGKLLGKFRGSEVAFAADGKHWKSAEVRETKTAVMTFSENGQKIAETELPIADNCALSLSPAGSFAAGYLKDPGRNLGVFDLSTNKVVKRIKVPGNSVLATAFDPTGKVLIARADDRITVWDWRSGEELFDWSGQVFCVPAISQDGKRIAWKGNGARTQLLWLADLPNGKPRPLAPLVNRWGNPPTFSPDGKSLAVVTDGGAVQILDVQNGRDRLPLPALTGRVWHVNLTSDRRRVIGSDVLHTLVWDAATAKLLHRFPDDLPDGEQIVRNTIAANLVITFRPADATVRLRDLDKLREIRRLEATLKPFDEKYGDLYRNGAVTPDEKLAAIEGVNNLVCVFDLNTGKLLSQHPLAGQATQYRWLGDGRFLAIDREGFERPLVLDPGTGKEVPPSKWPASSGSPGGRWPEWGEKAVARLRKLNLLDAAGQAAFGNGSGFITEVTESAGGRYLAAVGREGEPNLVDDRNKTTFWLFDLATRRQLGYVTLPQGEQFRMFSPDSRLFATTTLQGTIHLREVATGRERCRFAGHMPGEVTSVAFTPDGQALLSGGADTQVFLWDLIGPAGKPKQPLVDPWTALAADDASEARHAIASLIADPKHAVALIGERLKPPPVPDTEELAKWAAELGHADFATREKATAALAKAGEFAIPQLRRALIAPNLEQRRRAESLLRGLEGGPLTGDRLRAARAVELLERIASPEARQVLKKLAEQPATRLAVEAKESLRRIGD